MNYIARVVATLAIWVSAAMIVAFWKEGHKVVAIVGPAAFFATAAVWGRWRAKGDHSSDHRSIA
jgi:hypothetical protein